MELYPNWTEWKARRASDGALRESKGQSPNYSFDNWLKMANSFGDEVSSFVGQAKEKDKELDGEIKKKKQAPPDEDSDDADSDDPKTKETAWNKLRDIAKERRAEQEKKDAVKAKPDKPVKSSKPVKPSTKS